MASITHSAARTVLTTVLPHLHAFQVDTPTINAHGVTLAVTATTPTTPCPLCRMPSRAVHSRYTRTLADLPVGQQRLSLYVHVRRFFCHNITCGRRIFRERLQDVAAVYRRHTDGLYTALQQSELTLGGKAGVRLATTLHMPTSWMTMLRRVRTLPTPTTTTLRVLGVDDWSWRKGRRWDTILVDLEQHRLTCYPTGPLHRSRRG